MRCLAIEILLKSLYVEAEVLGELRTLGSVIFK